MFCQWVFLHSMWRPGRSSPQFPSGWLHCRALAAPAWPQIPWFPCKLPCVVCSHFLSSIDSSDNSCNASHMMTTLFTNAWPTWLVKCWDTWPSWCIQGSYQSTRGMDAGLLGPVLHGTDISKVDLDAASRYDEPQEGDGGDVIWGYCQDRQRCTFLAYLWECHWPEPGRQLGHWWAQTA